MKHPLMKPGGMSDLTIPEYDPPYSRLSNLSRNNDLAAADCKCRNPRDCYCYDNGHTGDTMCLACGEEIK